MSKIILDRTNLIAFARVSGFLDAEHLLQIASDADEAIQAFGNRMSHHGRLFDLSEAKVASPATIRALRDMTVDPARAALRANRVAYFGASPLLKMQMAQICAVRPSLAMFDDRRSAYAWAVGGR